VGAAGTVGQQHGRLDQPAPSPDGLRERVAPGSRDAAHSLDVSDSWTRRAAPSLDSCLRDLGHNLTQNREALRTGGDAQGWGTQLSALVWCSAVADSRPTALRRLDQLGM
jgi:hypothetical protein